MELIKALQPSDKSLRSLFQCMQNQMHYYTYSQQQKRYEVNNLLYKNALDGLALLRNGKK